MYLRESLLSNFRMVHECHTHSEDQIRTYVCYVCYMYLNTILRQIIPSYLSFLTPICKATPVIPGVSRCRFAPSHSLNAILRHACARSTLRSFITYKTYFRPTITQRHACKDVPASSNPGMQKLDGMGQVMSQRSTIDFGMARAQQASNHLGQWQCKHSPKPGGCAGLRPRRSQSWPD